MFGSGKPFTMFRMMCVFFTLRESYKIIKSCEVTDEVINVKKIGKVLRKT